MFVARIIVLFVIALSSHLTANENNSIQTNITFTEEINKNFIRKDRDFAKELKANTGKSLSKHYSDYINSHSQEIINSNLSQIKEYIDKKCDKKLIKVRDQDNPLFYLCFAGVIGSRFFVNKTTSRIVFLSSFGALLYIAMKNGPKTKYHTKQIEKIKEITRKQFDTFLLKKNSGDKIHN